MVEISTFPSIMYHLASNDSIATNLNAMHNLLLASDDSTATKVDASSVIPLKKQQGFLNMFGQMASILGSKLEPQLAVMFPITIRLGSFCAQLLEQRDQVMKPLLSGYLEHMKHRNY